MPLPPNWSSCHPLLLLFWYIFNKFSSYPYSCFSLKVSHMGCWRLDPYNSVIATEFMEGGDLAFLFHKNPTGLPSRSTALKISCDILSGLSCLQEHNIIHQNLKPTNILFTTTADGILEAKITGKQKHFPFMSISVEEYSLIINDEQQIMQCHRFRMLSLHWAP